MSKASRRNWKTNAIGASVLAASTVFGVAGISAQTSDTTSQADSDLTTAQQQTTPTPQAPATGTFSGRGGRGGRGGDHHLEGLNTNPPAVELAPDQSAVETTASTVKIEGAPYYDGQYYGDAVNAGRWGQMQVVAVIENGELTDVLIANYPRSTYESDIITRNALPTLISESIEAQDSNIDMVSRATDSSRAFVQSLESALLDAAIGVDL